MARAILVPACFSEQAPIENLSHSMHHDANWVILQNLLFIYSIDMLWLSLAVFHLKAEKILPVTDAN